MANIVNNLDLWRQEADLQAKKQAEQIKANNQHLIDQLNTSKNNSLEQLQKQQDNSIYNLNTNKSTINKTAEDNAKQANINRLLALKSNEQALNRAGLGTQGVVGSQNASINNSYGSNLTSILNQKTNDLRELEKDKNDTLLKYNENRINIENEYGNNLANLRAEIDSKATDQYNLIFQNVLANKQQEWENEQARLAQEEAIRQYNEQLAYQKQQDALAQANWEKEYALSKASAARSAAANNPTWDDDSEDDEVVEKNNNVNKASQTLTATMTPTLSTKQYSWYGQNFSPNMTLEQLNKKIAEGVASKKLKNEDIKRIQKAYGLS